MFKVHINSEKHGYSWLEFNTRAKAENYISEVTQTQHWGDNERVIVIAEAYTTETVDEATGEVTVTEHEAITEILPATWSASIEDVSAQRLRELEIAKYKARMNFGQTIMAELAVTNIERLKAGETTLAEIISAEAKLATVQRLLLNGSTSLALAEIVALDLPEYTETMKTDIITKIQNYLASEA